MSACPSRWTSRADAVSHGRSMGLKRRSELRFGTPLLSPPALKARSTSITCMCNHPYHQWHFKHHDQDYMWLMTDTSLQCQTTHDDIIVIYIIYYIVGVKLSRTLFELPGLRSNLFFWVFHLGRPRKAIPLLQSWLINAFYINRQSSIKVSSCKCM